MDFIKRETTSRKTLCLAEVVQNAVGHNSAVLSEKMTVSFCHYSAESGPMEPHNHAEGIGGGAVLQGCLCEVGQRQGLSGAHGGAARGRPDALPSLEWHVFGYKEGGYLDALVSTAR